MNVLITNDDGIKATGLQILREAAKHALKSCSFTVVSSPKEYCGRSFSTNPGPNDWKTVVPKEIEPHVWELELSPVDLIHRAFQTRDLHPRPFELVLVGCNHGLNLGTDVFHGGTTAAAMAASSFYGACAYAFNQELPKELWEQAEVSRDHFLSAERVIVDFLRKNMPSNGDCWNVNIPTNALKGYKNTRTAHYSYVRTPPTNVVPRARNEESDITVFQQGFVALTQLMLRVNPPLKY